MKFNIILFQFGTVSTKIDLYKKCFDSIKKAFPKDNIYIFYNPEEIYEKYNIPKKDTQLLFETDYLRLYLSKYFKNLLWFDSDIDLGPCKGFRNLIVSIIKSNKNKDFISFANSIGCFFSRKENKIVNTILEKFDFKMGDNMIRRQYLPREVVFNLDRCYNHYFCLNTFMNEFKDENEFLIVDFKNASYEDILHGMEIYDYNKTHKYKIVFTSSYPDYMITQTDQLKVLFTTISKEDLALYIRQSLSLRDRQPNIKVISFKESF